MSEPETEVEHALRAAGRRPRLAAELPRSEGMPILPPWTAIFELVVFVLAVEALAFFVPGFDFTALKPNPGWLPVLLLSLQYGTVSGLLAAFTATVLSMIQGLPEQEIGENYYAYLVRSFSEPMLWLGTAMLIGQFRLRQISEKRELKRIVSDLTRDRAALADFAGTLRSRCDRLEREIVTRPRLPMLSTMAAIAGGRTESARPAGPLLHSVLSDLVPGVRASLFELRPEGAIRIALLDTDHGPESAQSSTAAADAISPPMIAATHPLLHAIEGEGRALTVLRAEDEPTLDGLGLAAVPVRASKSEPVRGLLLIERAGVDAIDPATLPGLELAAEGLASAMDHSSSPIVRAPDTVTASPAARHLNGPASVRPRTLWEHVSGQLLKVTGSAPRKATSGPSEPKSRPRR